MQERNVNLRRDLVVIALLALAVRMAFVFFAGPHVYGDGTGYPRQGMQIVSGEGELDTSWLGAFSFWMAAVYLLIPSIKWCAIIGTLIPGVLLVSVAQWIGIRLYGRRVGCLSGLFCAFHPLLITYSTNGYMETFYCLLLALATLGLTELFLRPAGKKRMLYGLFAGLVMALAFATRNEAILLALAILVVPWCAADRWSQKLRDTGSIALGLGLGVGLYVAVALGLTGDVGLFGKVGNLSRHSDIFLEREAAAAEVYGAGGIIEQTRIEGSPDRGTETESDTGVGIQLSTLTDRLMKNMKSALPWSAVRLFASPLPLLALIPIFGWLRGRGWRRELIPVGLMLVFFPAFFSLYAVQPRYLMPIVVPVHLLAAAGVMTIVDWFCQRRDLRSVQQRRVLSMATVALLLFLVGGTLWKGSRMRAQRDLHQQLAAWLDREVPIEETIAGCGFGHIGDTTFRSGHPFLVRLHTDQPEELERFIRERTDGWLVLYEDYLSDANPALRRYLDEPLPGFVRRHEVRSAGGLRAQVFELNGPSASVVTTEGSGQKP
jgi:hypothetical protein